MYTPNYTTDHFLKVDRLKVVSYANELLAHLSNEGWSVGEVEFLVTKALQQEYEANQKRLHDAQPFLALSADYSLK